jgi:hypothetical protein
MYCNKLFIVFALIGIILSLIPFSGESGSDFSAYHGFYRVVLAMGKNESSWSGN